MVCHKSIQFFVIYSIYTCYSFIILDNIGQSLSIKGFQFKVSPLFPFETELNLLSSKLIIIVTVSLSNLSSRCRSVLLFKIKVIYCMINYFYKVTFELFYTCRRVYIIWIVIIQYIYVFISTRWCFWIFHRLINWHGNFMIHVEMYL